MTLIVQRCSLSLFLRLYIVAVFEYVYWYIYTSIYKMTIHTCRAVSAQLWPHKMLTGSPLMVIYIKRFRLLCYISRPNGLGNKISSFQTQFWQNQARSQVLMLWRGQNKVLGGKDFCFYYMLKNKFFWAHLGRTVARKFSILGLHVCAEGLDILKIYF